MAITADKEKQYRVNEIFYSLQGEGALTGTPAVFLRFSGCNLRCPFCDTDFEQATSISAKEIVAKVTCFPSKVVIATGGEPLLQLDKELVEQLTDAGMRVHVETNGTIPSPSSLIHWITCSPKEGAKIKIDPAVVDELKVVMTSNGFDPEPLAREFPNSLKFLQPCSCANTEQVVEYIKAHPHWRLSLQTHKLINIP